MMSLTADPLLVDTIAAATAALVLQSQSELNGRFWREADISQVLTSAKCQQRHWSFEKNEGGAHRSLRAFLHMAHRIHMTDHVEFAAPYGSHTLAGTEGLSELGQVEIPKGSARW